MTVLVVAWRLCWRWLIVGSGVRALSCNSRKRYDKFKIMFKWYSSRRGEACKISRCIYRRTLGWDKHIHEVACKVSRNVGILGKLKHSAPLTCLLQVYNSLVLVFLLRVSVSAGLSLPWCPVGTLCSCTWLYWLLPVVPQINWIGLDKCDLLVKRKCNHGYTILHSYVALIASQFGISDSCT